MSLDNQNFIPRPSQVTGAVNLDDKVPEIIVFTDFLKKYTLNMLENKSKFF